MRTCIHSISSWRRIVIIRSRCAARPAYFNVQYLLHRQGDSALDIDKGSPPPVKTKQGSTPRDSQHGNIDGYGRRQRALHRQLAPRPEAVRSPASLGHGPRRLLDLRREKPQKNARSFGGINMFEGVQGLVVESKTWKMLL